VRRGEDTVRGMCLKRDFVGHTGFDGVLTGRLVERGLRECRDDIGR